MSSEVHPPEIDAVEIEGRPWGLAATIGFSLIVAATYLIVYTVFSTVLAAVRVLQNPATDIEALEVELSSSGDMLAWATLACMCFVVAECVGFAALRREMSVRAYLGLRGASFKAFAIGCMLVMAFAVSYDVATYYLGRPVITDWMIAIFQSASMPIVLVCALVIGAPVAEEFFFRGFLFKGLAGSFIGGHVTVFFTAALWAIIHVQYGWYEIAAISIAGVLLGYVRLLSGSLLPCLLMHALMNVIATAEVYVHMKGWIDLNP